MHSQKSKMITLMPALLFQHLHLWDEHHKNNAAKQTKLQSWIQAQKEGKGVRKLYSKKAQKLSTPASLRHIQIFIL